MTKRERNIEALKEVRERILKEQLYMASWVQFNGVEGTFRPGGIFAVVTEETLDRCNTKGCLAGWAILNQALREGTSYSKVLHAARPTDDYSREIVRGAQLLGLDSRTANAVFIQTWPLDLEWGNADHQLALIDGLIAGWYLDRHYVWRTADGAELTRAAL